MARKIEAEVLFNFFGKLPEGHERESISQSGDPSILDEYLWQDERFSQKLRSQTPRQLYERIDHFLKSLETDISKVVRARNALHQGDVSYARKVVHPLIRLLRGDGYTPTDLFT